MHELKINKLSEAGLQDSELRALDQISKHLPPEWLAYSNFEFRQEKAGNREIDLVLVTEECLILVELKNWNGELTQDGKVWVVNGQRRGRSPVEKTNDKCKLLKSFIQTREGQNLPSPYIVPAVVLCGSSTPDLLSAEDKSATFPLREFLKIGAKTYFRKAFPDVKPNKKSLNKYKEVFNRIFSLKNFDSRRYRYDGFILPENPIFSHPEGYYSEFIAKSEVSKEREALLRVWSFNELPIKHSASQEWRRIANRENIVLSALRNRISRDVYSNNVVSLLSHTRDEDFHSTYFELYETPPLSLTLDEFLARRVGQYTPADRLSLAQSITGVFKESHEVGFAHRDIAESCLWTSDDFNVAVSRWLAAYYPDTETIGGLRTTIRTSRSILPEDSLSLESDPFRRDVFLLGATLYLVYSGQRPPLDDGVATFRPFPAQSKNKSIEKRVSNALERAMNWDPQERFPDATEFYEELGLIRAELIDEQRKFDVPLDHYRHHGNPFIKYPVSEVLKEEPTTIYRSQTPSGSIIVKVWDSLNLETMGRREKLGVREFLRTAEFVSLSNPDCTARIVDYGISNQGVFLAAEEVIGKTASELIDDKTFSFESRTELCLDLVKKIESLHSQKLCHGDVKPSNIVVDLGESAEDSGCSVTLIDMPDIEVGLEPITTPYYQGYTDRPLSTEGRDRLGALLTIVQLLGGSLHHSAGGSSIELSDERLKDVSSAASNLLHQEGDLVSLLPLVRQLRRIKVPGRDPSVPNIEIKLFSAPDDAAISDDDGELILVFGEPIGQKVKEKVNLNPDNVYTQHFLCGLDNHLKLLWDENSESVARCQFIYGIPHARLRYEKTRVSGSISVQKGKPSTFEQLTDVISDALIEHSLQREGTDPESKDDERDDLDGDSLLQSPDIAANVSDIWTALIHSESESVPELTVVDVEELERPSKNHWLIQYERRNKQPVEFDYNERVLVSKVDGDYTFQLGELVKEDLTQEVFVVDCNRPPRLLPGDIVRIETLLSKSSLGKRKNAIERITSLKSVYPKLIKWFEGPEAIQSLAAENADEIVETEVERADLNDTQSAALRMALTYAPIGLVQGPPGTGKTHFIASLLFIIARYNLGKVLLVGQSHEAVNSCVNRLIASFSLADEELDLVRVGPVSMCSEVSRKHHIDNVKFRYQRVFRQDVKNRIIAAADGLPLPKGFIRQFVRLHVELRPLIREHNDIVLYPERSDHNHPGATSLESIKSQAIGRLKRVSVDFSEGYSELEMDGLIGAAEVALIRKHGITNKDATMRLRNIIDLALEWISALSSPHGNFEEFLVATKQFVAGTCVGVARGNLAVARRAFDWVIIDEAARCTSGELAVPLQVAKRAILVGDHRQLQPLYTQDVIDRAKESLPSLPRSELTRSDFDRIADISSDVRYISRLSVQYRMVKAIGKMVADLYYEGQLKTRKDKERLAGLTVPECLNAAVTWINTEPYSFAGEAREQLDDGRLSTSFVNRAEQKAIVQTLDEIVSCDALVTHLLEIAKEGEPPIGIICTYAGQKRELLRRIREHGYPEQFSALIKIDTVDSYQGKENLIILLSLVRNNRSRNPGFLSHHERINVAVSRAMEKLLIFGSAEMWRESDSAPSDVLSYIESRASQDANYVVRESHS